VVVLAPAVRHDPATLGDARLDPAVDVRVLLGHGLVESHLGLDEGEFGVLVHHAQHAAEGIAGDAVHGLVPAPAVAQVDMGVADQEDDAAGQGQTGIRHGHLLSAERWRRQRPAL